MISSFGKIQLVLMRLYACVLVHINYSARLAKLEKAADLAAEEVSNFKSNSKNIFNTIQNICDKFILTIFI